MALGKNIKIDQLIPEIKNAKDKNKVEVKIERKNKPKSELKNIEDETFKIWFTPSRRKKVKKVKVNLEGDLTIVNIEKVKESIAPVFDSYDYVDFVLENVSNIDVSCIQFLLAVDAHSKSIKKEVTVKANLSKGLKTLVSNAGFNPLILIKN